MLGIVFQHQELQIIKGVAKFPADPNSAEQGLTIFDLKNEQYFALRRNGYQPNIATHEAVWGDSVLRDGRFPVTGREINVTETIRLTAKADSWQDLAGRLSVLHRLVQDCHDYWETEYQIEPVYLKWWAEGAPGEQYALLYKMNVIVNREDDDSTMMDVRIELEREPLWRGLAPGANPILWQLRDRHGDLDTSDLSLISGSDHLATETIQNRHEWDPTDYVTRLSKNYIDIPGDKIPGDAPALILVTFPDNDRDYKSIYISLSTRPTTLPRSDGFANALQHFNILNAADGNPVAPMAVAANADGVFSDGSAVVENIIQGTILAATTTLDEIHNFAAADISTLLSVNMFRGSWAVFCRHVVTTGSNGDLKLQLRYGYTGSSSIGDNITKNEEADAIVEDGTTGPWNVAYLGIMTLPLQTPAIASGEGVGLLANTETSVEWNFEIFTRNTSGADRVLEIVDFVLMPIGEGFCEVINLLNEGSGASVIVDNTGYLRHGIIGDSSVQFRSASNGLRETELRGSIPRLRPNVNNRLFLFWTKVTSVDLVFSEESDDTVPRINIIPRWRGIRDVK